MTTTSELRDKAIIRPVKRAVEDELLDLPGVLAVDIGEKRVAGRGAGHQAIVVSVGRKGTPATGKAVPDDVLGIPTDVIEEVPVPHHGRCAPRAPVRTGEARPCERGMLGRGIAPSRSVRLVPPEAPTGRYRRVGTLGVMVHDHERASHAMGLTTFDVACMDDAWSIGDHMLDPDAGDVYAELARAALSGRVDAAAVELKDGVARTCLIRGVGPVAGKSAADPGATVRKTGYTTGTTSGTVVSTDTTLRLDHGPAIGVRVLREQVRVDGDTVFAARGDAGAALVDATGRVVGLHCAGNRDGTVGFACPIEEVLDELDVDLCVAPTQN